MHNGDEGFPIGLEMHSGIGNVSKNKGESQEPSLISDSFDYIDSPARFFGEPIYTLPNVMYPKPLSPSDFSITELPPPEVSNNIEVLREINLKLANELRLEKTKLGRFYLFSSRLAKKLGCLGQLSSTELKTCFTLGIQVEVSNLHWLLYRSPWTPTRDVGTETGNGDFVKDRNNNDFISSTEKKENKSIDPKYCTYNPQMFHGIPAISLPMPMPSTHSTGDVDQDQTGFLGAKNRKQTKEISKSETYNEDSQDSIIILHQAPVEPYPIESSTEMFSTLQSSPALEKDGDSKIRDFIQEQQQEAIHCKASLEHMDQMNNSLRGDIQVAIESAREIKEIASYISNFELDNIPKSKDFGYGISESPTHLERGQGHGIPKLNFNCKPRARKSQIPIRIPQIIHSRKHGEADTKKY